MTFLTIESPSAPVSTMSTKRDACEVAEASLVRTCGNTEEGRETRSHLPSLFGTRPGCLYSAATERDPLPLSIGRQDPAKLDQRHAELIGHGLGGDPHHLRGLLVGEAVEPRQDDDFALPWRQGRHRAFQGGP